ncbi:VOC family protein [Devosia nitrariae]|nr:VOC family protein [Devosia nitrariae]
MSWHIGRLIDHVHLRAANFALTKRFYSAVLGVLGLKIEQSGKGWFQVDELFVDAADARTVPTHVHLAFQARDRAMVDAFYKAALASGGTDNGPPGERDYHPGYYAAFVLDPDGNNIEAVYHGPSIRSAPSVTIDPA